MGNRSTIAALVTPHGASALAVVRASGRQALSIVENGIHGKDRFRNAPAREMGPYRLQASGENAGEILAAYARQILEYLDEHVAKPSSEDILNLVFGKFRIGKWKNSYLKRCFT